MSRLINNVFGDHLGCFVMGGILSELLVHFNVFQKFM